MEKNKQFPSIYRFIPEFKQILAVKKNPVAIFYLIVFLGLLGGVSLISIQLYRDYQNYSKLDLERYKIESELALWENINKKFPGYRDAYFEIGRLQYRLGDKKDAWDAIEKSLTIDPNFKEGRELEQVLSSKY